MKKYALLKRDVTISFRVILDLVLVLVLMLSSLDKVLVLVCATGTHTTLGFWQRSTTACSS